MAPRLGVTAAIAVGAATCLAIAGCGDGEPQATGGPDPPAAYVAAVEALVEPPAQLASAIDARAPRRGRPRRPPRGRLERIVRAARARLAELRALRLQDAGLRRHRDRLAAAYARAGAADAGRRRRPRRRRPGRARRAAADPVPRRPPHAAIRRLLLLALIPLALAAGVRGRLARARDDAPERRHPGLAPALPGRHRRRRRGRGRVHARPGDGRRGRDARGPGAGGAGAARVAGRRRGALPAPVGRAPRGRAPRGPARPRGRGLEERRRGDARWRPTPPPPARPDPLRAAVDDYSNAIAALRAAGEA